MEIRVLGPIEVVSDQAVSLAVGGSRQLGLLALLIAFAGEARSVDQIVEAVWGDHVPANPKGAVQVAISRLRKELGADRVLSRGPGYLIRIEPDELDADVFDRMVVEGRHAAEAGQHRLAIERFDLALSLWRGDPYADFSYEDFVRPEILRLQTLRDGAVEGRLNARIAVGEHSEVLPEIEAQLASNPLHEGIWASYLLALYRAGRQADALRAFQQASRTLGEELGIEPGPDLRLLEEQIVLQSSALDPAHLVGATALPEGEVALLVADAGIAAEETPDGTEAALSMLDEVVVSCGGHVFRSTTDQRFAVFEEASAAVAAVIRFHESSPQLLSFAIHVTEIRLRNGEYLGLGVSRVGRIGVIAMPGEVLVTEAAMDAVSEGLEAPAELIAVDARVLPGTSHPETLFRLTHPTLPLPVVASAEVRANLPALELSTFIGRAAELAEARELVASSRLVTFTGPGGVGKTRLALQAASDRVGRFAGGVWLVELASVRESEQVVPSILASLGIDVDTDANTSEVLRERLRKRPTLLVLDNCEHLIDAVADVASSALMANVGSAVIATSRERIGLAGEVVYQVPRLATPDADAASDPEIVLGFEAVELFRARARDVVGDFEVTRDNASAVATLCRRLDGIPLAIELAAGRTDVLRPAEMVDRLAQRFSMLGSGWRHGRRETLRETIEWSYSLLEEPERRLFEWLTVFAGPFDLEAVEAVCFEEDDAMEALNLIGQLIAKSLVVSRQRPNERTTFEVLETISAFGRERLVASSQLEEAQEAHGRHFSGLVLEQSRFLFGPDAQDALRSMLDSIADIRAAIDWAIEQDEQLSLRLLSEVNQFWLSAGLATEGVSWADRILGAVSMTPTLDLGRGLKTAGALALRSGGFRRAREWLDHAISIASEVEDPLGRAMALTNLSVLDAEEGKLEAAADGYVRALETLPDDADPSLRAMAVGNVGAGLLDLGDHERAMPYFREKLELAIELDSPLLQARALGNIGLCHLLARDLPKAEDGLRRGLDLVRDIDPVATAIILSWLAALNVLTSRIDESASLCTEALELALQVNVAAVPDCLYVAAVIAVERDRIDDALILFGAAASDPGTSLIVPNLLFPEHLERARAHVGDPSSLLAAGSELGLENAATTAMTLLAA